MELPCAAEWCIKKGFAACCCRFDFEQGVKFQLDSDISAMKKVKRETKRHLFLLGYGVHFTDILLLPHDKIPYSPSEFVQRVDVPLSLSLSRT